MAVQSSKTERLSVVATPPAPEVEEPATQRFVRLPELDVPTTRYEGNRRSTRRAAVELPAVVEAGRRRVAFIIDNLSVTGAKLQGSLTLVMGDRIVISFELGQTPIVVRAEVVRVHTEDLLTDQIAVRFVAPSEEPVSCIDAFITALLGAA